MLPANTTKSRPWRLLTAPVLLGICIVGPQHSNLTPAVIFSATLLASLLWLWYLHFESAFQRQGFGVCTVLAVALLASRHLHSASDPRYLVAACLFYLVVWTFDNFEREPNLQKLATMALLTCIGIFATPVTATACAVASIAFFVFNQHRATAEKFGFALLLFTPGMLCLLVMACIALLDRKHPNVQLVGAVTQSILNHNINAIAGIGPKSVGNIALQLMFPLAMLISRTVARCINTSDIAASLILIVVLFSSGSGSSAFGDLSDLWLIGLANAIALLTVTFRRVQAREPVLELGPPAIA